MIFIIVLIITFLQVLHIFEEIALKAYKLHKGENSKALYLRVSSILVFINFLVLYLLYAGYQAAYYLAFYTVVFSTGNMIAHLVLYIKDRKNRGYGLPTSIPLGLAGLYLLWLLISYIKSIQT